MLSKGSTTFVNFEWEILYICLFLIIYVTFTLLSYAHTHKKNGEEKWSEERKKKIVTAIEPTVWRLALKFIYTDLSKE